MRGNLGHTSSQIAFLAAVMVMVGIRVFHQDILLKACQVQYLNKLCL